MVFKHNIAETQEMLEYIGDITGTSTINNSDYAGHLTRQCPRRDQQWVLVTCYN